MKSFVGILVYIDQSQIFNLKTYHNLLFSQLTQAEIRAFFYGYFHEGFELNSYEKSLIKKFFLQYDGRDLIQPKDIELLKD